MKTLKLFTSDGRALTAITGVDDVILLPNEIQISESGTAMACHASLGDESYPTLADLCNAYCLDESDVLRELSHSA